jgi:hypothetical protein
MPQQAVANGMGHKLLRRTQLMPCFLTAVDQA